MPCLKSQLRKIQNYILYIRNIRSLQLKQISLITISDIFMYEKNPQKIFLLWQPSWISYCIKALLETVHKQQGHILSLSIFGTT